MKFNWNELPKEKYEEVKTDIEKYVDGIVGFVRAGELCVDVLIRNYEENGEDKYAFSYDVYVANEDTGYGYKGDLPYDYADGIDIEDLNLSYDDFVKQSESVLSDFLEKNDREGHDYSLIEKAEQPLLVW